MKAKQEPIDIRKRYHYSRLNESKENRWPGELEEPTDDKPHNLVSSLCDDGKHRPVLDIDIPCQFIPSSTEGHGHLYFPTVALSWLDYYVLLKALADAGIIERRYFEHSVKRGQTLVRPPHVKKGDVEGATLTEEEVAAS